MTSTETARAQTTCDHCGQTDDHPKANILGPEEANTFHHDCLSKRTRDLVVESSPVAAAIVEACEGGLRGDDLLAFNTDTTTEGNLS